MSINSFYKNFIIILIVLLCSCSEEKEQRKKITIGETFKINISESISDNNNVIFQWWVGDHPENSDYGLEPKGNNALLTPDIQGKYNVYVSIRDTNDIEIALIDFYYLAVLKKIKEKPKTIISEKALSQLESNLSDSSFSKSDTTTIINNSIDTLSKDINNKSKNNKTQFKKHTSKLSGWTIQLSSRGSLELAKKDQLKAIENGYDAYIEQTIINKTNKTWYRVRIGNFKQKATARKVQTDIKSFWVSDTWIDRVRAK